MLRAPFIGGNSPYSSSHSGSPTWTARAVPYIRRISGSLTNEHSMTVIRGVSSRWAAVSLPLPVPFSQTARVSETIRSASRPFGDTLTRPSRAAVATKNTCCSAMKSLCRSVSP